jgi:MFS family permease
MTDLFIDQIAKPHMKGLYFGAMEVASIGNSFGPALGGFLISVFGISNVVGISGLLALLSFLGFPFLLYAAHLSENEKRYIRI